MKHTTGSTRCTNSQVQNELRDHESSNERNRNNDQHGCAAAAVTSSRIKASPEKKERNRKGESDEDQCCESDGR